MAAAVGLAGLVLPGCTPPAETEAATTDGGVAVSDLHARMAAARTVDPFRLTIVVADGGSERSTEVLFMDGVAVEPDPADPTRPAVIHRLLEGYRHDFRSQLPQTAESDRIAVDRARLEASVVVHAAGDGANAAPSPEATAATAATAASTASDAPHAVTFEQQLLLASDWPEFDVAQDGATLRLAHDLVAYEVSIDPVRDEAQAAWLATYLQDVAYRAALAGDDPRPLFDAACLRHLAEAGWMPRRFVRTVYGPAGDERREVRFQFDSLPATDRAWVARAMQAEDQFLQSIGPRDIDPNPPAVELIGPLTGDGDERDRSARAASAARAH